MNISNCLRQGTRVSCLRRWFSDSINLSIKRLAICSAVSRLMISSQLKRLVRLDTSELTVLFDRSLLKFLLLLFRVVLEVLSTWGDKDKSETVFTFTFDWLVNEESSKLKTDFSCLFSWFALLGEVMVISFGTWWTADDWRVKLLEDNDFKRRLSVEIIVSFSLFTRSLLEKLGCM